MDVNTILSDEANRQDGWLTHQVATGSQCCRKCQQRVIRISGAISSAKIQLVEPYLTANQGRDLWVYTRLCELCFASVFEGHKLHFGKNKAHRNVLYYTAPGSQCMQVVRRPDGSLPSEEEHPLIALLFAPRT
ncbi:hypothetical protein [Pseudomonas putida]|uniref:Uncharacterized protein n=1 Tax=Pseudomonas putida TaxID=303 RepID=A0A8I1EGU3_PSEPU|nr:hypothetical protein [Pseudomonas putida]MBI6885837.1 hypothetical protein [Pseudomonas putida]